MHHMMHWLLPKWNFWVQEALILPIGICQPREACFCVDLSTSISCEAFFLLSVRVPTYRLQNSMCASSPSATSTLTGMYIADHNHHVISRLYLGGHYVHLCELWGCQIRAGQPPGKFLNPTENCCPPVQLRKKYCSYILKAAWLQIPYWVHFAFNV